MTKRIIFYYQTFTDLKPVLYKNTPLTHIHLSSIHFGKDNKNKPYLHLNDNLPSNPIFDNMWKQIEFANKIGIKIILMIGGAGSAYNVLFSNFELYYKMLYNLIKSRPYINGIDLDIEEYTALDDVKKLINRIVKDFGDDFIISMAPIQNSIENDYSGLGGFIYKDLINSKEGKYIDYLIGQYYIDYSYNAYDKTIKNGYIENKIVMGQLGGNLNKSTIKKIIEKYYNFGGVALWEYGNISSPKNWIIEMYNAINNN
jgi:chitinase